MENKNFKYPKLTILAIAIMLAYIVFTNQPFTEQINKIDRITYGSIFLAGMLYSFGFTAPFAVGIFILLEPGNIFLSSIIGGAGSLFSDLLIFSFIKISFLDEFNELKKTSLIKKLDSFMDKSLSEGIRRKLLYAIAALVIASPLPDEIGVSMLAGLTTIKNIEFAFISFFLNAFGILMILIIASVL